MQDSSFHDVVIAGAGPVGLFLACELRLGGASVLVLEQANDRNSPLKRLPFGMRGLSVPTVEAMHRRGLLEAVSEVPAKERSAESGSPTGAHWMQQARRPGGHFAGIQFFHDRIDSSRWKDRLSGVVSGSLPTSMERLEAVLAVRASAMGVEIRLGHRVEEFTQTHDGVTVCAGGASLHARWLVGCDGGRSVVRKTGGFEFVGTEPEFTGYSVEVELARPDALAAGRHYTPTGMYTYQLPGTIAMVDFDAGAFHRTTQSITLEHIQSVLRRVSGVDTIVTALHLATTWTDRAFQAAAYRKGRIFLAGDACHIHSPLGGQGLNLGLGDAMNLGWKLASVVRGETSDALLETYFAERHPVGAQVLDWSRAQVAIMRPSRSSRALEAIVRDLIETPDGATYFAQRVWGMSLRYELGDSHPLIGCSIPDFELSDGTTVDQHLGNGHGLLLAFDISAPLEAVAKRWGSRIVRVAGELTSDLGLTAVLVRPDGVVAWATDNVPDVEAFAQTATRWFGDPKMPHTRSDFGRHIVGRRLANDPSH